MSDSLTRTQAAALGLVVLAAVCLGGYGLARVADRQGFWADRVEVAVGFPDADDVTPGTAVRIRGVDAGEVVAVEDPDHDGPGAEVTVRLRLHPKYARRLYADASAKVHGSGVFGAKVVAVDPGNPAAGPLTTGRLKGVKAAGLDEAVAEVRELAKDVRQTAAAVTRLAADAEATSAEARGLVKDAREGRGTLGRLLADDDLYWDLKEMTADAKGLMKRADGAVGTVEGEVKNVRAFVADGRETLRSVRQGTDALARLPIVRSYVEDANALLVRPAHRRDRMAYNAADLFEPGTAIPRGDAGHHFGAITETVRAIDHKKAEVVVVAYADPGDAAQTPGAALETTRKQAEAVVASLKAAGVHKLGWTARRKITPLGMGTSPPPVAEKDPLPPANVQVLIFTPP
ncbi:MAG: MlaD family protein [Gemmataceae bacterium]|nr:MlaD family protein [Gemmataceae bacterium]